MLDCLIVGGGPAGLAVANTLQNAGFSYLIVEKGAVAEYIRQFPYYLRFFSTRDLLEIDGYPLTIIAEKPTRQEYLAYLTRFAKDRGIEIRTHTRVEAVERNGDGSFRVSVRPLDKGAESLHARTVVLAVGGFNNPRRLGVPGEDLEKVSSRYVETHPYVGRKVLVVGGRNSAAEFSLELWRAGADVSLSYRREKFVPKSIKYWVLPDIENRLAKGEIHDYRGTTVQRIDPDTVTLARLAGNDAGTGTDEKIVIENDFVLTFLGYDPPVAFMRAMGVKLEPETNRPDHNPETLETNVPGVFVAGVITAGNVSGGVFIENSRHHGDLIAKRLKEICR